MEESVDALQPHEQRVKIRVIIVILFHVFQRDGRVKFEHLVLGFLVLHGDEVGVVFIFKLSDSWQQYTIPFSDFIELQEWDNLKELLFSFVENSGSTGIMYLDEITLTKR